MTYSFFIECDDCSKKYRIRYGLGNNYPQFASFQCDDCSKNIEIGHKEFKGKIIIKGAKHIEVDDSQYWDVTVQNLHPEIPTHNNAKNDPYYFQTANVFQNAFRNNLEKEQFQEEQQRWGTFNSKWDKIEMPLRILSTKGEIALREVCGLKFRELFNLFNEWLWTFTSGELEDDYENICDEYNSLELTDAKLYIRNDNKIFNRIYELCNTYMKRSHQFQSTILYQKFGWEVTEDMTANVNWEEICTIYGDLYEIVGDLFVIPTIMNNVKAGRNFDEFKTVEFSLSKYIQSDKAKRAMNFENNSNLSFLANSYFSWLRNGTHHKNSFLNIETNEVDLGTGKGSTIQKKISLTEYVKSTNELFGVGLILSSIALNMNK
ncbi:hypothetical protein K5X82_07070 [Halosquirtibacter xylanolyticus]|uniref:hypothetical protein n=1 Tax=Halosquirtibacter xylanolyticus TaxID=3374599 RepID=UPI00374A4215|nr:hypothetical protein K5X82_07070 [Prolixibacteraceae bacterium]